jgi:hypothetical protein
MHCIHHNIIVLIIVYIYTCIHRNQNNQWIVVGCNSLPVTVNNSILPGQTVVTIKVF